MGTVVKFTGGKAKHNPALSRIEKPPLDGPGRGCITFTDMGGGISRMRISGSYAKHMQFGLFAIIKGLATLSSRVVESGHVGHHSEESVQESIKVSPRSPRRQREWKDLNKPK